MNFYTVSVRDPAHRVVVYKSSKKVRMTPAAPSTASASSSPSASRKSIERCIGVKEEIIAGHAVGFV